MTATTMALSLDSLFSQQKEIDTLRNVLLKLKDANGSLDTTPTGLWLGDTVQRLNDALCRRADPSLLPESKACLQSLRNTGSILVSLQESLQQATTLLESTILPFESGRGLSLMPDNILSTIFDLVCREPGDWFDVDEEYLEQENLSLVCRRFRNIISNSPHLWNNITINTRTNIDKVNLLLRKSKSAGLEVELFNDEPLTTLVPDTSLEQLLAALHHSSRWEFLELDLTNRHVEWLGEKVELLQDLHLPRLQSLAIYYPFPGDPYPASWQIYKTCKLEMLRSFRIVNVIPEPFTSPLLTTFFIELYDTELATNNLLDFLSANPTLEDIHISLSRTIVIGTRVVRDVELKNVRVLEFSMSDVSLSKLYPFRKALYTPKVSELTLFIGPDSEEKSEEGEDGLRQRTPEELTGPHDYIGFIFCHKSYPCLKQFFYIYNGDGTRTYELPFEKLPMLRVLSLRTKGLLPSTERLGTLPPLLRIHVYCETQLEKGWVVWFQHLRRQMMKQGILSSFEKLYIVYHDYHESVDSYFGERVAWTNNHWGIPELRRPLCYSWENINLP